MAGDARYLQIYEALQHQIGALAPNTLLASENDLAKRFGVSRITIRRALGLLERTGVVSRQRGRGTTVNPPKITRWLSPMYPFEEDLRRQGIEFETRILGYAPRFTPSDFVRDALRLPPSSSVGFLSLARLVDNRVICYGRHYFPPDVAEKFDPSAVLRLPVADVLCQLAGQPMDALEWTSEIVSAPRDVAAPLGITPGVLVFVNTGTEYLSGGSPIQVAVMCYRIDRVKFRFAVNYAKAGDGEGVVPPRDSQQVLGRAAHAPRPNSSTG